MAAILFLLFGSVVLPIKAIAMTLLSLSASFGALVWIFQEGNLSNVLDFTSPGFTIAGNPIIMFCVLFGLSMDYEVLLLSRMQEAYRRHHDNTEAVAEGLSRTARVITGAAVIMVTVFAAFALADTVTIKSIGVGMAIAVLIDATIVRMLLVPATMRLLGDWNWWAPGPLGPVRRAPRVQPRRGRGHRGRALRRGGGQAQAVRRGRLGQAPRAAQADPDSSNGPSGSRDCGSGRAAGRGRRRRGSRRYWPAGPTPSVNGVHQRRSRGTSSVTRGPRSRRPGRPASLEQLDEVARSCPGATGLVVDPGLDLAGHLPERAAAASARRRSPRRRPRRNRPPGHAAHLAEARRPGPP